MIRYPALVVMACLFASEALAHGVSGGDAAFLGAAQGVAFWPYFYLGAKHMVTGYDHLLFLLGVVFFLRRPHDIVVFVTLFSAGHSITLMTGVLSGLKVSPPLVDAVIGFSVVYKALDNLGLLSMRHAPGPRLAVFGFGLIHGLGLSTKLQDIALSPDGLIVNMVAFNLGVEAGQIFALTFILAAVMAWRQRARFAAEARAANWVLMSAGFVLMIYHLTGFALGMSR